MKFPWRSRSQRDADLNDEIQAHLRMAEADRIARGETITDIRSHYGVTARDPGVLVASAVMLFLIAIVAALLPAWRASRVDPITVLRAE